MGLSICYVHSCIADAAKGPKTLIPYLFVISLVFVVPLPTENIILLFAFHRAVTKGFSFIPSLKVATRLGSRHLGTNQDLGSDRLWCTIVKDT